MIIASQSAAEQTSRDPCKTVNENRTFPLLSRVFAHRLPCCQPFTAAPFPIPIHSPKREGWREFWEASSKYFGHICPKIALRPGAKVRQLQQYVPMCPLLCLPLATTAFANFAHFKIQFADSKTAKVGAFLWPPRRVLFPAASAANPRPPSSSPMMCQIGLCRNFGRQRPKSHFWHFGSVSSVEVKRLTKQAHGIQKI